MAILEIKKEDYPFKILKNDKLDRAILKRIVRTGSDSFDHMMNMEHISDKKMGTTKLSSSYSIYLPSGDMGSHIYGLGGFAILHGSEIFTDHMNPPIRDVTACVSVYSYGPLSHYALSSVAIVRPKKNTNLRLDAEGKLSTELMKTAKYNEKKLLSWMKEFYRMLKDEKAFTHNVFKFAVQGQSQGV